MGREVCGAHGSCFSKRWYGKLICCFAFADGDGGVGGDDDGGGDGGDKYFDDDSNGGEDEDGDDEW